MFQNSNHRYHHQHHPLFKCIIIQRQDVFVYETRNHKIYLLGTNHTSEQSVKAIQTLITWVQPQIVAVELCHERLENANLFKDRENYEKKYRDLVHVPRHIRQKAVGEITRLILAYQALQRKATSRKLVSKSKYKVKPIHIDENLTIAGDVFSPFKNFTWHLHTKGLNYLSSPEASYKIILADRPISVTYAKLAEALNDEEKMVIRTYKKDFLGMFFENQDGIMKQIWKRNEDIKKIMVQERDECLAESILRAAELPKKWGVRFSRVVAIVGRTHIDGILAEWISQSEIEHS